MTLPLSTTGKSPFEVAHMACEQAGESLLSHFRNVNQVKHKGRRDLQTEADLMSEKLIKDILCAEFPSDAIVTEESASLSGTTGYKWIIDPLDGTNNYFYGLPYFAVNIALVTDRDRDREGECHS